MSHFQMTWYILFISIIVIIHTCRYVFVQLDWRKKINIGHDRECNSCKHFRLTVLGIIVPTRVYDEWCQWKYLSWWNTGFLQYSVVCFMLPWLTLYLLSNAVWTDSFFNEPGSINWKYIEQIVQGVLFQRKNNSSVNIL